MAEGFLTVHRENVYDLLVGKAPSDTAITHYLPDDVAELPVVVVGRPAGSFRGTDLGVEIRVPVHVIGRKFADDGAQIEHDQLTDEILGILWDNDIPLIAVLPTVQAIAGNTYPGYDITTLHAHTVCPCS